MKLEPINPILYEERITGEVSDDKNVCIITMIEALIQRVNDVLYDDEAAEQKTGAYNISNQRRNKRGVKLSSDSYR